MIEVFIEAEAGSCEKGVYDEQTLSYKYSRRVNRPYPYPYGFVVGTCTDDGEAVDCYLITSKPLKAGTIAQCQPVGLLEQSEDGENDNKVLAVLPGQTVDLDVGLLDTLRNFIYGVFRAFPGTKVRVGEILPKAAAIEYIRKHQT
jgi:inorganic pyrophosphatase